MDVPPPSASDGAGIGDAATTSPTSTTSSIYVADDAYVDGVETGLRDVVTASSSSSSSSSYDGENDATRCGSVRREVLAPRGKLGVIVANAFRPNESGAVRYGPAVFSLKAGSPMAGLLNVGDVIVAIDDVDTSEYTVERLSQLLIDTVGRERKITVLSARR